jgi:hypothetical protein
MSIQDKSRFEHDSNGEEIESAPVQTRAPSKVEQKREQQITGEKSKAKEKLTLGDFGTTERLLDDNIPTYTRHVSKPRENNHTRQGNENRPFGPSVTLTAFASTSTPLRMLARPSLENLISL